MENSSRNKILRRSERVALVYLLTNQMTNRQGQMCESKFRNETKSRPNQTLSETLKPKFS